MSLPADSEPETESDASSEEIEEDADTFICDECLETSQLLRSAFLPETETTPSQHVCMECWIAIRDKRGDSDV